MAVPKTVLDTEVGEGPSTGRRSTPGVPLRGVRGAPRSSATGSGRPGPRRPGRTRWWRRHDAPVCGVGASRYVESGCGAGMDGERDTAARVPKPTTAEVRRSSPEQNGRQHLEKRERER